MQRAEPILDKVCQLTGVTPQEVKGKSRKRLIVDTRAVYCRILREQRQLTYKKIGKIINRTHPAVMHLIHAAEDIPELNKLYQTVNQ